MRMKFLMDFVFFNFQFIPTELNEKFCFYYAIEYDHFKLVEYYKNIERLNINEIICQVRIYFFSCNDKISFFVNF